MIKDKKKILIIDTSAILSGKQINFKNEQLITTTNMELEIKPGGRDYRNYIYLKEKCLIFKEPSKNSLKKIFDKVGVLSRMPGTLNVITIAAFFNYTHIVLYFYIFFMPLVALGSFLYESRIRFNRLEWF